MKSYIIAPLTKLTKYNIKIIFGNKFLYFVLSAVGFYILTVALSLISDDEITTASGYNMLLVPSILLIFYPACFGIQNDQDAKIIEIIFGIPNYRYKVWLFRLLISVSFSSHKLAGGRSSSGRIGHTSHGTGTIHRHALLHAQHNRPER